MDCNICLQIKTVKKCNICTFLACEFCIDEWYEHSRNTCPQCKTINSYTNTGSIPIRIGRDDIVSILKMLNIDNRFRIDDRIYRIDTSYNHTRIDAYLSNFIDTKLIEMARISEITHPYDNSMMFNLDIKNWSPKYSLSAQRARARYY